MFLMESGRKSSERTVSFKPLEEGGFQIGAGTGADLLFQVISHRYERGSLIITTNKVFKSWPETFNNDATIASAILDRLLHRSDAIVVKGRSYRMKDVVESPA